MENKTSKNDRAEKIVGLRKIPKNSIIFDQPCELGYHCPVCKYEDPEGDYDERLEWSEYEGFLWCSVCNKDYPSCLCIPDKDKAIEIYLDSISYQKHSSYTQGVNETLNRVEEMFENMKSGKEEIENIRAAGFPDDANNARDYDDFIDQFIEQLETLKEER